MGVGQVASGAEEISTGLNSYVEGIAVLAENSYVLYESASELNQAMVDIKSGMSEYQKGTETFKAETSNMDVTLEAKVDDLMSSFMGEASETRSFASVKNEDVASVQFFFRTQAIAKEKMPIVVEEVVKTTFWQRIKNLFNW
jgi:methyl-accepting chemotaxis protein